MLLTLGEMGAVYLDKSWKKNGATLDLERGNNEDELESSKMVAGPGWEMI